MGDVCVFAACSVDGFMAGPDGELDWLEGRDGIEDTFTPFIARVGAILMGRRTFDFVAGLGGAWPYGDIPLLVATSRGLTPPRPSVRAVHGDAGELIAKAQAAAGDKDVYLDGGELVRAALEAGLVDEITVSVVPIILGRGRPLFAGIKERCELELVESRPIGGGLVELRYRPATE